MRDFWAIILFLLGFFLVYPGVFIWQLALTSMAMLASAVAIVAWEPESRRRPIAQIFAWMAVFLLVIEAVFAIFIRR